MITTAELHDAAHREGLRFDQVEKDYVILCVLSALVRAGMKDADWTFKGGACLRHCYYPGYRFSEDIDFSCRPGDDNVVEAARLLKAAAGLVSDDTGMAIDVRAAAQSPGQEQLEIPLHYSRGGARRQARPAVRVHLTFDEPVLSGAESRTVLPIYSGLESFQLNASVGVVSVEDRVGDVSTGSRATCRVTCQSTCRSTCRSACRRTGPVTRRASYVRRPSCRSSRRGSGVEDHHAALRVRCGLLLRRGLREGRADRRPADGESKGH